MKAKAKEGKRGENSAVRKTLFSVLKVVALAFVMTRLVIYGSNVWTHHGAFGVFWRWLVGIAAWRFLKTIKIITFGDKTISVQGVGARFKNAAFAAKSAFKSQPSSAQPASAQTACATAPAGQSSVISQSFSDLNEDLDVELANDEFCDEDGDEFSD